MRTWTLNFIPPLVWTFHLYAGYALHGTACDADRKIVLFALSLICLAVVGANAVFAWSAANAFQPLFAHGGAGGNEDVEPRPRSHDRFLTMSGLASSLFFALVIIAQSVPMLILRPCD